MHRNTGTRYPYSDAFLEKLAEWLHAYLDPGFKNKVSQKAQKAFFWKIVYLRLSKEIFRNFWFFLSKKRFSQKKNKKT